MRTPEHPAKYRIVQWLGRNFFPRDGIQSSAHPNLKLRLHPRDWIEYQLIRGDRHEPKTLHFLTRNLRPGDTAVLAGVNFGQHVAVAARAVGINGRVIGVEPQPRALIKTWDNLQLNDLEQQVSLVSAALGECEEMVRMAWSDVGNSGCASLLDKGDGLFVQVRRLSQLLRTMNVASPRILLLDVQGYETKALTGISEGPLPQLLVVEVEEPFLARLGKTPTDLLDQVRSLGYQLKNLNGEDVTNEFIDLPEFNLIGVMAGVDVDWMKE